MWRLRLERAMKLRTLWEWLPRVAGEVKRLWPDAEVYLVGSLARGDYTGASDVDILIVTVRPPKTPLEAAEVKVRLEEAAGVEDLGLLDIHYTTPAEKEEALRRYKAYRKLA